MSTTYDVQTIPAQTWRRCYAVVLHNPLDAPRMGQFQEEDVVQFGDRTARQEAGSCAMHFEAEGVCQLLDPSTGEPTGQTFTHATLYQMLYSAYRHAAAQRDSQQAAAMNLAKAAQAEAAAKPAEEPAA